ncbi:hypothetical protein SBOR_7212 [Sclerotinia borealis F-4128]|uniref:Uncharacterized protein n=1 Tax=Sclerotinia borealis (strain F-4128) TaxID=1432307 RepID=W9CC46_SCLBF|nr:hypothetical protein SBOR_7212 [Sclerotinia borealis F-4128]
MDDAFEIVDLPDGYHICELSGDRRAIEPLVAAMQLTVSENNKNRRGSIFYADLSLSDPSGKDFGKNIIYEMFSRGLPNKRRMMSCEICETFIRDFGNLCYLSEDATLVPLVWPAEDVVPEYYQKAVANVRKLFEGRPLGREFLSHLDIYNHQGANYGRGKASNDTYRHMDVEILGNVRSLGTTQSEELGPILEQIIARNDEKTISRAHTMLIHDVLPLAKSYKTWITWLKNAATAIKVRNDLKPEDRRMLMARYAFLAEKGCLPSLFNGELAQLMSSIEVEEDIPSIKSKWIQLVNPQKDISPDDMARTTSRLMSELGYNSTDFDRSFIKLNQIQSSAYLWTDSTKPSSISQSPFRTLDTARQSVPATLRDSLDRAPIKQICFRKFCLQIIPQIFSLSLHITEESQHAQNFHFLTTGADDATKRSKPIYSFQEQGEHTAAWYKATHITSPEEVDLCSGWVKVKCILSFPHMWAYFQAHRKSIYQFFDLMVERGFPHKELGMRFLLVLDAIMDRHGKGSDLSKELLNEDLGYFSREQLEVYRDGKSIRGSHVSGHVGGVPVEDGKFRKVMLGVRLKSGEFVRYEVVQYKYFVG